MKTLTATTTTTTTTATTLEYQRTIHSLTCAIYIYRVLAAAADKEDGEEIGTRLTEPKEAFYPVQL